MKIVWIMLMLISASISASLREYAPLQDAMVDRQDGVTITQKVTAQDDGTLRIRLQIDMEEEIAALQAEAGKHSLQEVQPVDPIAIGRRESVNRLSSGLWQLHIPMCAGAYVVEADTALQVSSARDEVCFDVSAWMSRRCRHKRNTASGCREIRPIALSQGTSFRCRACLPMSSRCKRSFRS